jgi:hypothetical protein
MDLANIMKKITSANLGWIPPFILAIVTTGILLWPIVNYMEREELAGRIHPPDWLTTPIAILIIGFCLFLTRIYIVLFALLFHRKK